MDIARMISFSSKCPDVAAADRKGVKIKDNKKIPDGEYLFLESYCDDPDCDCRRVMVNAVSNYETCALSDKFIFLNELGSGRSWQVFRTGELRNPDIKACEIWYVRLVGQRDKAYILNVMYYENVFKGLNR